MYEQKEIDVSFSATEIENKMREKQCNLYFVYIQLAVISAVHKLPVYEVNNGKNVHLFNAHVPRGNSFFYFF